MAVAEDMRVVRGGQDRDPVRVLEKVRDAVDRGEGAVLSVQADTPIGGETEDAVILRLSDAVGPSPRSRYGKVQVSTASRVRAAGLKVQKDDTRGQGPWHHNVVFPDPPQLSDAEAFICAFDEPILNPAKVVDQS